VKKYRAIAKVSALMSFADARKNTPERSALSEVLVGK
jgi:hypothetical protein